MVLEYLKKFTHFILLGYGLEGKANEAWIKKNLPHKKITIIERIDKPLAEVDTEAVYVISPGISRQVLCGNIPKNQQTSGTEIFMHNVSESQRKKLIGISGSKGKTTTTKFTYELLQNLGFKSVIGGNFGVPLLTLWDQLDDLDFIVAELSSYQLENIEVSPYYGLFLNFFTDHVSRHGSLENYWNAKQNLWAGGQKKSAQLFIPQDFVSVDQNFSLQRIKDSAVFPIRSTIVQVVRCETLAAENFVDGSIFRSPHFCQNFGCAVELVKKILSVREYSNTPPQKTTPWIPDGARMTVEEAIKITAQNFCGEPHRMEFFAEHDGIRFYDDSIATNIFAAKAVVEFFGPNLGAIVLGGRSESGELGDDWVGLLSDIQKKSPQAYLWLPAGDCFATILAAVESINFPVDKIIRGADFSALLEKGLPFIQKNSAVVLSPAAKSFDRFVNFRERGKAWKKSVAQISEESC